LCPGFFLLRSVPMRILFLWLAVLWSLPLRAAERQFNFSDHRLDRTPPGFRSTVAGRGKPGEWKVILDDQPPASDSATSPATGRAVLAQLAREPVDLHFPMLVFEEETFVDFKLQTRFKIVGGALEQMAGIVFRFQNESNFYVVRASAPGRSFRCYKVENGVFKPPIGPEVDVVKGSWHDLSVQCEGNRIVCALDGKELIKLIDSSGSAGKVGFWTKSDSVSYFKETKITYTPRETLAQLLVRETTEKYSRLQGLKIFAAKGADPAPVIVASKDAADLGQAGGEDELGVIRDATNRVSKNKGIVSVTAPLRDRNGEPIAAVCVMMKSFPGETQDTSIAKAVPIVKEMQVRVQSLEDLLQ